MTAGWGDLGRRRRMAEVEKEKEKDNRELRALPRKCPPPHLISRAVAGRVQIKRVLGLLGHLSRSVSHNEPRPSVALVAKTVSVSVQSGRTCLATKLLAAVGALDDVKQS